MAHRSVTGCVWVYVCGSVLSPFTPLSQRTVKRWAAAVQAGNSVIAFSVPEAGLSALNQKRQSLSVMAQLIIKHVSYLRRAPPIYFHLSDRDGCTNSISTINKGSINISPFLQKQIIQLINCPMSVNSNNPKINKETSDILWFCPPKYFCVSQLICLLFSAFYLFNIWIKWGELMSCCSCSVKSEVVLDARGMVSCVLPKLTASSILHTVCLSKMSAQTPKHHGSTISAMSIQEHWTSW